MSNNNENSVVAVYADHTHAEAAVKKLTDANIPIKEISIIGKGYHTDEKVVGFYNAGDRIKFWGKYGAFWGALWGILAGGLFVSVPVLGPVVVVGSFAAMVFSAIEGAVIVGGLSALGGALASIGIPNDTVLQYENAIKADSFLILVQGTAKEVERARDILKTGNAKQVNMHCCNDKKIHDGSTITLKAS